jgi:cell division protein FtsL
MLNKNKKEADALPRKTFFAAVKDGFVRVYKKLAGFVRAEGLVITILTAGIILLSIGIIFVGINFAASLQTLL